MRILLYGTITGILVFLLIYQVAGPDTSPSRTIDQLKADWEALKTEADTRLQADFKAHADEVCRLYQTIIDDQAYKYTVFPQKAREEIKRINQQLSASGRKSEPVLIFQDKSVQEPVQPDTEIQPAAAPAGQPHTRLPEPEKEIVPATGYLGAVTPKPEDIEAGKLYNSAAAALGREEYSSAYNQFQALLDTHGKAEFTIKHQNAINAGINQAVLMLEQPSLCLYFTENFDADPQGWEGQIETDNGFMGSRGSLKAVYSPLSHAGVGNTRICLKPQNTDGLFPLMPGQRINFAYYMDEAMPIHIQLWDKDGNRDLSYDIKETGSGQWYTASIPLAQFSGADEGELKGACWYLSLSIQEKSENSCRFDDISITGPEIPHRIKKALFRQDDMSGLAAPDFSSEGIFFTAGIARHCRSIRKDKPASGSLLVAGDRMAEWLNIYAVPGLIRKYQVGAVRGENKTCRQIQAKLPAVLKEYQPDVIAVLAGWADITASGGGMPFTMQYEKIIITCIRLGTIPVVFGIPVDLDPDLKERVSMMNDSLLKMARTYRVPYIDSSALLSAESDYSGPGRLSVQGKRKLSEGFYQLYRKMNTYIFHVAKEVQ